MKISHEFKESHAGNPWCFQPLRTIPDCFADGIDIGSEASLCVIFWRQYRSIHFDSAAKLLSKLGSCCVNAERAITASQPADFASAIN
jgi:hypothetical protein